MRNFKNDNELLGGNEMPTLYELKQSLGMIGQQLKNKTDELSQKATDPNIDMEDIKQLETEKQVYNKDLTLLKDKCKTLKRKKKRKLKIKEKLINL